MEKPLDLSEVEEAASIVKRFATGRKSTVLSLILRKCTLGFIEGSLFSEIGDGFPCVEVLFQMWALLKGRIFSLETRPIV